MDLPRTNKIRLSDALKSNWCANIGHDRAERIFHCALGPTEILATIDDDDTIRQNIGQLAYDDARFDAGGHPATTLRIWESYKLDEEDPVVGNWPNTGDSREDILEKLNDDMCECTPRNLEEDIGSINFGSTQFWNLHTWPERDDARRHTFCNATIRCELCGWEATILLHLTKRWLDGREEDGRTWP